MNWLLLRGLAREQRHFGAFPRVFAERVQGSAVHLLDLPGAGTERGRSVPLSIAGLVRDLRARWEPLQAQSGGPWGILGISLGAMVAMEWSASHPEDFSRVVLANTSAAGLSVPWMRMRVPVLLNILRAAATRDLEARERRVISFSSNRSDLYEATAREWARYAREGRKMRPTAMVAQITAAARFRAPARLPVPALIVVSRTDRLCDASCSEALARHFGAPLVEHPTAGHDISTDAPEWLADEVAAWCGAPRTESAA